MRAAEFDRRFDAGEDMDPYVDWSTARRPNAPRSVVTRVTVALPAWILAGLDRRAQDRGISRQDLIRTWIAERLRTHGSG